MLTCIYKYDLLVASYIIFICSS